MLAEIIINSQSSIKVNHYMINFSLLSGDPCFFKNPSTEVKLE